MRDSIRNWQGRGINIVMVGNGNRYFAEAFREEFELAATLLLDTDLEAYRAAGLRRGLVETLSPRLLGNAIRAYTGGARQVGIKGDPWQLGGVFVFARGGELAFEHRSREAGDHASASEIEAALPIDPAQAERQRDHAGPEDS